VVSPQGRIGVSGPEVIETNKGIEEYDSRNKALVWSVCGGKTRRLLGSADALTEDTMDGFRAAAIAEMKKTHKLDLATLQAEQDRLQKRQDRLANCSDALSMWNLLGIQEADKLTDMDTDRFIEIAKHFKGANHDAR
jgi:malonate decarboxylase beta subunit